MLYKRILTQYGASLRGAPRDPKSDVFYAALSHFTGQVEDLLLFRKGVLDAMVDAKAFFLDHEAADYVDYIGDTTVKEKGDLTFMRDILIPEDVVWIEYDAKALAYAQKRRKDDFDTPPDEIEELNLRGMLIDNRDPNRLFAWVFRTTAEGGLIDPLITEEFEKDRAGFPVLATQTREVVGHSIRYMEVASRETGDFNSVDPRQFAMHDSEAFIHLFVLSYTLFAALRSMKEDVQPVNADPFTHTERKNAAKFGKSYITEAPKSHLTINLREPGKKYMSDVQEEARRRRRGNTGGSGSPRVKHVVREHQRVYKSGKIVIVKAHERGSLPDKRPTRVTASKSENDDGPT